MDPVLVAIVVATGIAVVMHYRELSARGGPPITRPDASMSAEGLAREMRSPEFGAALVELLRSPDVAAELHRVGLGGARDVKQHVSGHAAQLSEQITELGGAVDELQEVWGARRVLRLGTRVRHFGDQPFTDVPSEGHRRNADLLLLVDQLDRQGVGESSQSQKDAVEALMAVAASEYPVVRGAAVAALVDLGMSPSHLAYLLRSETDSSVWRRVTKSLAYGSTWAAPDDPIDVRPEPSER